jgi:hypothetical protein
MNLPPQIGGLRFSDRSFETERGELFEKHRPGQSPCPIAVRLIGRGLPNVRHAIMLVLQRRLGTPRSAFIGLRPDLPRQSSRTDRCVPD